MFQFTRFPPHTLWIQMWVPRHYPWRVSPFGNPRIIASVQLPAAYRRLRVLLRQLVPRHSSHTLRSLTILVALRSVRSTRVPLTNMQLSKSSLAGRPHPVEGHRRRVMIPGRHGRVKTLGRARATFSRHARRDGSRLRRIPHLPTEKPPPEGGRHPIPTPAEDRLFPVPGPTPIRPP